MNILINSDLGTWTDISKDIVVDSTVTINYARFNEKIKHLAISYKVSSGVTNLKTFIQIPIKYGKFFNTTEFAICTFYDTERAMRITHFGGINNNYNYIKTYHSIDAPTDMNVYFTNIFVAY